MKFGPKFEPLVEYIENLKIPEIQFLVKLSPIKDFRFDDLEVNAYQLYTGGSRGKITSSNREIFIGSGQNFFFSNLILIFTIVYKGLELVAIAAMIGTMGSEAAVLLISDVQSLADCSRARSSLLCSQATNGRKTIAKSKKSNQEIQDQAKNNEEDALFKLWRVEPKRSSSGFDRGQEGGLNHPKQTESEKFGEYFTEEKVAENEKKSFFVDRIAGPSSHRNTNEGKYTGPGFRVGVPRVIKKGVESFRSGRSRLIYLEGFNRSLTWY